MRSKYPNWKLFFDLLAIPFSAHAATSFNISTVGDCGCSSNTKDSAKNINNKNPELVLGLGDYSYQRLPSIGLIL
jgi:hypothetical protein